MLSVILMYTVIGILGLLVGSFLNVCICRIPNNESISFPPSHCTSCNHKLGVLDLFPLFSWLFLKGKCRYCKEKISVQYPIVEFVNMVLWLFLFSIYGFTPEFLFAAVIFSVFIVLTVIDIFHMILPDKIIIFLLVISVLYVIFIKGEYLDSIYGILAGGGFFLLIVLLSKGAAMGMGDVKLMSVLGLLLGFKAIILTCGIAFVIGAVFSVALVMRKKAEGKTAVPFGPFICAGAAVSLLYAEPIVNFYLSFCTY